MPLRTAVRVTGQPAEQIYVLLDNGTTPATVLNNRVFESQRATEGLAPNLEYLPIFDDVIAPYDPRVYNAVPIAGPDREVTPAVWRTGANIEQKTAAELIVQLDNLESQKNSEQIPFAKILRVLVRAIGVLFQLVAGQTLNAAQIQVRQQFLTIASTINTRAQKRDEIEAKIQAAQPFDFDELT